MKITKKVLAPVMAVAMVASSAVCVSAEDEAIALTLWGAEEDQDLLKELVGKFEETYSDFTFDIEIGVESESTAKDTILTDVEAAADVYAFASDQIYDLVNAGALANLDEYDEAFQAVAGKSIADVKAANSESSVAAATVNDSFYAFPMAGDNSYFLFYDSSVVSPEDAQSWDTLLAAAEAGGKKVGMTLSSGWYNAGFFYGAGFTTDLNEDGTTVMDWNGTSASGITGVDVVKSMLNIAGNSAFQAVADGDLSNQIAAGGLCAVVSGTWDASAAQDAFGDGYSATKLPTFTVNDEQVQMGSAFGYKFVGVNAYAENIGWAAVLAEFLTNEDAQVARFDARQIGPTNLVAVESDAVKANLAITAVIEQSEFGVIQKVGGKYWDPAQTFGENIAQGKIPADDDAAIQEALDTLVEGVTAPVE
ncbi:extracellular solute-binding protein [Ruminococcus sp. 5_1_39BFAA]|uniref:extracellular solute-binding protein n=1 Tax=Ruminococcus sp. 5_1_39BFAA TaxID=457412 RepID=UPI003562B794